MISLTLSKLKSEPSFSKLKTKMILWVPLTLLKRKEKDHLIKMTTENRYSMKLRKTRAIKVFLWWNPKIISWNRQAWGQKANESSLCSLKRRTRCCFPTKINLFYCSKQRTERRTRLDLIKVENLLGLKFQRGMDLHTTKETWTCLVGMTSEESWAMQILMKH